MTGVLWREKRHGTCRVSNREAQCCEGMIRKWNVGELCKKSLKVWSIEAVCCTCLPTKFCVSFFPFCSLWACSRSELLLPTNVFNFLLQNTLLNLGETVSMWCQSSGEIWSSHCCDPKGRSQYINLPSHMGHGWLWVWRGHKPSKGVCNFIIEGEESLPGLSPGNPLNFVSFFWSRVYFAFSQANVFPCSKFDGVAFFMLHSYIRKPVSSVWESLPCDQGSVSHSCHTELVLGVFCLFHLNA